MIIGIYIAGVILSGFIYIQCITRNDDFTHGDVPLLLILSLISWCGVFAGGFAYLMECSANLKTSKKVIFKRR